MKLSDFLNIIDEGEKTSAPINPEIMSIDTFFQKEAKKGRLKEMNKKVNEEDEEEKIDDKEIGTKDIDSLLSARSKGGKLPKGSPIIHRNNIVDENGKQLDKKELMKKFSVRPAQILNQNSKLGESGGKKIAFYNVTLPAYAGLYHDEKNHELKIVRTCPGAGECKNFCYAMKGGYIMFEPSSLKTTRIITYLMNDWEGFKKQLTKEIQDLYESNKKQGIGTTIRWHDAGDFFKKSYLKIAYEIAKETPDVTHYAYTKAVSMVDKSEVPSNFKFTYSMGGKEDVKAQELHKEKNSRISVVVPANIFKDKSHIDKKKESREFDSPEAKQEVIDRIAKHYDIKDTKTIITYDELMKKSEGDKPVYNVMVKKGDGDDAATRTDVSKILLFFH